MYERSMDKLKIHSLDASQGNIVKLRELFPNCVTEACDEKTGKPRLVVDFALLRQELDNSIVESAEERYHLSWPGKQMSLKVASAPPTKTLRPARDESVHFDTTKNLFIEGDNLEALKLLQETYLNKVKMIYIDPPYNTGNDFVYNDDFSESANEYLEKSNQVNSAGERLIPNPESCGRFHSNWLQMLYPRIKIARNFLRDDGIFFMSLDDNEVHNGLKICEEIFGTNQFIACLPTIMNLKGNNDQFAFAGTHEYTIVYAKNKPELKIGEFSLDVEELEEWENDDIGLFKRGANLKATGKNAPREKRPNLFFPLYVTDKDEVFTEKPNQPHTVVLPLTGSAEMSWRWDKKKFVSNPRDLIVVRSGSSLSIYKKQRPKLGDLPSRKPKSIFYKPEYSSGNGTSAIKSLFGASLFDAPPKPPALIEDLIEIGCPDGGLVLDFFAGSGTTGHAAMSLAQKTGKEFPFILIQLDEKLSDGSEATKQGFNSIADIAKERIRRAGTKIFKKRGGGGNDRDLDIGFRSLKVDSSNMKDVNYLPDKLKQKDLIDAVNIVKEERTEEDLLFEVLIKLGIAPTLPIQNETVQDKAVFFVGDNSLIACFDSGLNEELVEEIAKYKPLYAVFLDNHFANDSVRINADQVFLQHSPDTVVKAI